MRGRVFAVDLASCTGCFACSVACKDRAGLPDDLDLLRVETHETGAYPDTRLYFRVVHCFHCEAPPCAEACPTGGIVKGEDGRVSIDDAECTGCATCVEACPFGAIVIRPDNAAAKCDACADETAGGWDPACVRGCPMRALWFGPAEELPFENRIEDTHFSDHGIGPSVLYLRRPDE